MVKRSDSLTLAELRNIQGWTQKEVGDALGVRDRTVSTWEVGRGLPNLDPYRMLRMMELYGCETLQELADAVAASIEQARG